MDSNSIGAEPRRRPEIPEPGSWGAASGAQESESDRELDLRKYLDILRRRWKVIAGTAVAIVAVTAVVVLQLTPRYTATTALVLHIPKNNVVSIQSVAADLPVDFGAVQSEADVLRSRSLAGHVAERLQLKDDPAFNPDLAKPGRMDSFHPLAWLSATWVSWFGAGSEPGATAVPDSPSVDSRLVNALLGGLTVKTDPQSYTIKLSFESPDPKKAALIANTFADQYLLDQLEAKFEATRRGSAWINQRLDDLRQKVRESDQAVQDFRAKSNLIQTNGQTVNGQQLSELNSQLILARSDEAQAQARLGQIRQLVKSGQIESSPDVLASGLIQNLRQQEVTLLQKRAELSTRYSDQHPVMVNLKAELRDLHEKIALEVAKIVQSIANQAQVAAARVASLSGSLQAVNAQAGSQSQADVRLGALQREADANHTLFDTLLARSKETIGQNEIQQADARIISAAQIPTRPSFPRVDLFLGFSVAAALGIGFMLALVIERLDDAFRSLDQLEKVTGLAALGIMPILGRAEGRKADLHDHVLQKPNSAYTEAIQAIRTALHYSDVDRPPKVVLITSALPEEGKTTFSVSMARMAARSGQKVVLVEADLRRPNIAKKLGLPAEGGLTDVLTGELPLDKALRKDSESGLTVLPARPGIATPQDVLASARMRDLLRELSEKYDLVIIDSPPVMAVSDAIILAKATDTVLLLARWGTTPRGIVVSAARQLQKSRVKIAGVVLTRVNLAKYSQYGQGSQGYYYRRYASYYSS